MRRIKRRRVHRKMESRAQTSKNEKNLKAVKKHLAQQKENITRLKSSKLKSREKLDCLLEEKDQLVEEIRKCRAKLWLHLVSIWFATDELPTLAWL